MAGKAYYVELGTGASLLKYGFKTGTDYSAIADTLGVVEVTKDNSAGIAYGCNNPKPKKVRISYYINGTEGPTRTAKRFVATAKEETVAGLAGETINIRGQDKTIATATV
jgi:hypothetical protein